MRMIAVIIAAAMLVGCGKVDTTPLPVADVETNPLNGINDWCIDGVTYLRAFNSITFSVKYNKVTLLPETCTGTGLIKSR